ncbi:hypothetical protein CTEN210_02658 [Chaetoceros tenuissimus]|uniref:F-box domain-containing protein n=1 Tax=Chaetoceros tenuissimus TaxID=426638 RepID=A0AAD3CK04_9STRA|nr:hypothetical protein CTEN210_02658 [Chaetoceros tenuissimus]
MRKKKNRADSLSVSGGQGRIRRRRFRCWKKSIDTNRDASIKQDPNSPIIHLPVELLANILSFVGDGNYIYSALTCSTFNKAFSLNTFQKNTNLSHVVSSISCTNYFIKETRAKTCDQILLLFKAAVENEKLDVIHYLYEKYEWEDSVKHGDQGLELSRIAAKKGSVNVLKFLRRNDFSCDSRITSLAAEFGHLNILQYAHENSCPWKPDVCYKAAAAGHFEVLQYAFEHGCPWDAWTCIASAEAGHLDILKWAKANNCPWDSSFVIEKAAAGGHLHIVQWCLENGCEWNDGIVLEAEAAGHLHIVEWAIDYHMISADIDFEQ